MEVLSSSISDVDQASNAKSIAKALRSKARELDDKANEVNLNQRVLDSAAEISNDFKTFLSYLNDVPDEL